MVCKIVTIDMPNTQFGLCWNDAYRKIEQNKNKNVSWMTFVCVFAHISKTLDILTTHRHKLTSKFESSLNNLSISVTRAMSVLRTLNTNIKYWTWTSAFEQQQQQRTKKNFSSLCDVLMYINCAHETKNQRKKKDQIKIVRLRIFV